MPVRFSTFCGVRATRSYLDRENGIHKTMDARAPQAHDEASGSVVQSADRVADVVDSVKRYARQETVEPLRGAGRWLAFGVLGAVSLGLSAVFGVLGVLRLSQSIGRNVFDGAWTWVPYIIALASNVLLIALALSRINDKPLSK